MGKKVIRFGLSVREINKALKELEQYKRDLVAKTELLRKKVAERIESLAASGFSGAIVDDLIQYSGGVRKAQVETSVDERGDVSVVIAMGEDAIWDISGIAIFNVF